MISDRIRLSYDMAKMSGLIKNQRDLSQKILNSKGEPVSQSYISQVLNGLLPHIPNEFIAQLTESFPFFNEEFIYNGNGNIFNYEGLVAFICKKYETRRDDVCEAPERLEQSSVIEHFNNRYKLNIPYERIFGKQDDHVPRETDHHLARVLELIDHLRRTRAIHSDKEFCQKANIHTQIVVNMRSGRNLDVSKDTLYKILLHFPNVSADWIMLGKGDMFRNEKALDSIVEDLRNRIDQMEARL